MKLNRRKLLLIFLLLLTGMVLFQYLVEDDPEKQFKTPYSQVVRQIQKQPKEVKILLVTRLTKVGVEFKDPPGPAKPAKPLTTAYPDERSLAALVAQAVKAGVRVDVRPEPTRGAFYIILVQLIPTLVILAIIIYFLSRSSGMGLGSLLRKSFRRQDGEEVATTFADVAGVEAAVEEMGEVVRFLEDASPFEKLGARVPKGVLLVGPPGTGKTLLARAAAGESGAAFFSLTGSDFVEVLAGLGASVTGDTPVLIRDGEETGLVNIGEFVDRYLPDREGYLELSEEMQTLGYSPREFKHPHLRKSGREQFGSSQWSTVRGVYKHRVEEIYQISYHGGILRTTGDHSVFVRRPAGIEAVPAREMRVGDVLVDLPFRTRTSEKGTVWNWREHQQNAHPALELPLISQSEIDELLEAQKKYDRAHELRGTSTYKIAEELGVSQMTVWHWLNGKAKPAALRLELSRNRKVPVPVNQQLCRLLGLYAAEGSGQGSARWTFHEDETELHEEVANSLRELFGVDPAFEVKYEDKAVNVLARNAWLGRWFMQQCGKGAASKRVPSFLWTAQREHVLAFLSGYLDGDGHVDKEGKLHATSASKRLITELSWLCALHGIKACVGTTTPKKDSQIKTRSGSMRTIVHKPGTVYWRLTIGKSSNPFVGDKSRPNIQRPVVRNIKRLPFDGFVYDLCGCDNEAFYGGDRPMLLHNSRIRGLFKEAREAAPSIIFIDEIDAVGRTRSGGGLSGNEEREQTLNQLLSEMDGFSGTEQVVVMAATNRAEILDPALLRPGRFDRQIMVEPPDAKGREAILRVHVRGKPIDPELLVTLAQQTPGFTGAELSNLINEAALHAARRSAEAIEREDLNSAMLRVIAGAARERLMSEHEKEVVAYHEVGHALCSHFSDHPTPVQKISVVSRGNALGFTLSIPEQDRLLETRDSLSDQLVLLLGGRAAELEVFGEVTSGAASDLQRATEIAYTMVCRLGLSELVGPRVVAGMEDGYLSGSGSLRCSPQMEQQIEGEVRQLVDNAQARAQQIVREHREELERVSQALTRVETMEADEFLDLLSPHPPAKREEPQQSAQPAPPEGLSPSLPSRVEQREAPPTRQDEGQVEQGLAGEEERT